MERWTDQQLLVYIQLALGYINAAPLQTSYNIYEMPEAWETPVVIGAVIFALFGESILQAGETFSYSDNGLSLSINNAGQYQSLAQALLSSWDAQVKALKMYLRPNSAGIYGGMNSGIRIRSYSQLGYSKIYKISRKTIIVNLKHYVQRLFIIK